MNNNNRMGHFPATRPVNHGAVDCIRCGNKIVFQINANQSYYVSNDGAMSPYCYGK